MRARGLCVLGVGAIAFAACGHSTAKAASPPSSHPRATTTTTTTIPAPTATARPMPTTTITTAVPLPPPAASAACTSGQIATTATDNSGMGHIGVVLRFRNSSGTTCHLEGYPGAAALDAQGHQVVQAVRTVNGFWHALPPGEGPPVVTLAPGQIASAFMEGTDVPVNGATSCPTYPKLLVTPPNTTVSVPIAKAMPGCTPIQIHPVVPGTTGTIVH
ncbi:MAG TPA: DUF4232 domain-containing protein [Acidimicrobiia bacterium]|nr:DUF4232 domain-containing protein [Acidimicrobiia bacterium]